LRVFAEQVSMNPLQCQAYQVEIAGRIGGTRDVRILFPEHDPCVTLGRHTPEAEAIALDRAHQEAGPMEVFRLIRGGGATYHGPGQLIAYILADLRTWGVSIPAYIHTLEEAMIALLPSFGVRGDRSKGRPGVFLKGAKIGFVGVGVHHGVSLHGVSLNIGPATLEGFHRIVPCGMPGLFVGQLSDHVPVPGLAEVQGRFLNAFQEVWGGWER
jgi:lipoyl(octanoyl) transferase